MLAELQSALGVRRRDALGRVQRLEAALAAYRRAVEERVVAEFARDHGLRTPQLTGVSPETAARHLHEAGLALPELIDRGAEQSSAAPPQPSPTADTKPRSPSASAPPPRARRRALPSLTSRLSGRESSW